MKNHTIKFYPVGNGDTTFLSLRDNSSILIDCKIRESDLDENGNKVFDVKGDLLENIKKIDGKYYLDLFILSHPDQDHCLGFEQNFYLGDPDDYSEQHKKDMEIIVNELWITSSLFNNANSNDAKALKKEAERRRKLWDNDNVNRKKDGNRIRIIGYDGDQRFEHVPNSIPGDILTLNDINGNQTGNFEIFIHGPFKDSLIESEALEDKNCSSIIIQARFKQDAYGDWTAFFITGGDADHYRWEQVLNMSIEHENEDKLQWNLFQTPHHCSWSYFNDTPYENDENQEPKEYSLKILDHGISDSFIVASSRRIKKGKPNPPHFTAKTEYMKKVHEENFLNTDINNDVTKPIPIVFEVNDTGIIRVDEGKEQSRRIAQATAVASSSIVSGNWSSNE